MLCVLDENIPYGKDAFAAFGETTTMSGRKLDAQAVRGADILCVRSVTPVNAALLDGARVSFVGTATIGTDHVDRAWLHQRGIRFSAAPGSNANSVAEYVVAALLHSFSCAKRSLAGTVLGVVGVGHVGSKVAAKARALGMNVILNDPPRMEREGRDGFTELSELLANADVVSLHVPLEQSGSHPTFHLAGKNFFRQMKRDAFFINSSRGAVHDTAELLRAMDEKLRAVVLDVWENEPGIHVDLAKRSLLATPHIAGYSFDGKVAGTRMIFEAACEAFNRETAWPKSIQLPDPPTPVLNVKLTPKEIDQDRQAFESVLHKTVAQIYDIAADSAALKETLHLSSEKHGTAFDQLRKNYPTRREFQNTRINIDAHSTLNGTLENKIRTFLREITESLSGIGFRVSRE
jgi:erythronate-4-phosphate dehydrogenase